MNRRSRLEAAVAGKPVDRVPVSAWGHFYVDELSADRFADRMLTFRQAYDWDIVKVHARASYHTEPFGYAFAPSDDPAKDHRMVETPIAEPEDWLMLRPARLDHPAFLEQMKALELIRRGLPADVPLIMTVFTPLDVADKMLGRRAEILARHIREAPEAVAYGLSVIAATLEPFVRQLVAFGLDGVFVSTKWVNGAKLKPATYRSLTLPHDLRVLAPASGLPFNILHVCQSEVFLGGFADYPVTIMHWDDNGAHNPSLRMGRAMTKLAVSGGVDPPTLAAGSPEMVTEKAVNAIVENNGTGMMLAPGCSIRTAATPTENLMALRQAPDKASALLGKALAA